MNQFLQQHYFRISEKEKQEEQNEQLKKVLIKYSN